MNKINEIRDHLAEKHEVPFSAKTYDEKYGHQVSFKDGFDARGKIEEGRTKKLVEALEFLQRNTNALDYRRPVIDEALQEFKGEK